MCIIRRNQSPAPAARYAAPAMASTSYVPRYAPGGSAAVYSATAPLPTTGHSRRPSEISISHGSVHTQYPEEYSPIHVSPPSRQSSYVSSRGTGYYSGGSAQNTPQLVYSSASSIRSSSGSVKSEYGSDSPRGSWYGDMRPATRESRRSWCEEGQDATEYREWKGEVQRPLGLHLSTDAYPSKERRGAISPTVAPYGYPGY
ncbi:hypothetical protein BJ508DRAFT_358909 [Ascobolus immersus RN42]|uniref:Uncharacterized protein n=1 Tax=Ascobolus immersus RN42 TaxID=1160509 RepID=A0A3N4IN67_ASCIM|nr:hypothetical protein BJ508DRAFT_358909 [Ascobolus immersus RN42]